MTTADDPAVPFSRQPPYKLVVALGLVPALLTAWILWFAPVDPLPADRAALAGRDFTVVWAAGQLAANRAFDILSDPAAFTAYLRALFGSGMPEQIWPYPPPMLLLARLCAAITFGPAMLLYTAASLLAFAAALRSAGLRGATILAILLSPAVATNALAGQNGALIAAMLISGLSLIERRPVSAGALLAGLCIKPQFALLVPICVLARRKFSTAASGCIIAITLALTSALVFGGQPWADFVQRGGTTVVNYVGESWHAAPSQSLFTSVFMASRSLGFGKPLSYALQAGVALWCGIVAWRLWSTPAEPRSRVATTLALALLASPWVHLYDQPALAAAIVMLLPRAHRSTRLVLGFAWLWPGLAMLVSASPLVSVATVASVASVGWRQSRSSSPLLG